MNLEVGASMGNAISAKDFWVEQRHFPGNISGGIGASRGPFHREAGRQPVMSSLPHFEVVQKKAGRNSRLLRLRVPTPHSAIALHSASISLPYAASSGSHFVHGSCAGSDRRPRPAN
jgi:hypothetical protein